MISDDQRYRRKCPHGIGTLFAYHGSQAKEAWWCSVCDKDLYEEVGRPKTLGENRLKRRKL